MPVKCNDCHVCLLLFFLSDGVGNSDGDNMMLWVFLGFFFIHDLLLFFLFSMFHHCLKTKLAFRDFTSFPSSITRYSLKS